MEEPGSPCSEERTDVPCPRPAGSHSISPCWGVRSSQESLPSVLTLCHPCGGGGGGRGRWPPGPKAEEQAPLPPNHRVAWAGTGPGLPGTASLPSLVLPVRRALSTPALPASRPPREPQPHGTEHADPRQALLALPPQSPPTAAEAGGATPGRPDAHPARSPPARAPGIPASVRLAGGLLA